MYVKFSQTQDIELAIEIARAWTLAQSRFTKRVKLDQLAWASPKQTAMQRQVAWFWVMFAQSHGASLRLLLLPIDNLLRSDAF